MVTDVPSQTFKPLSTYLAQEVHTGQLGIDIAEVLNQLESEALQREAWETFHPKDPELAKLLVNDLQQPIRVVTGSPNARTFVATNPAPAKPRFNLDFDDGRRSGGRSLSRWGLSFEIGLIVLWIWVMVTMWGDFRSAIAGYFR